MTKERGTSSPDDLRTEFTQCAEDSRTVVHAVWQVVYIFLSATVVALALVTAQLIERPLENHEWSTFLLLLPVAFAGGALGLAAILINWRQGWLQEVTYARIREIEQDLGMWKNRYMQLLDDWPGRCESADWDALPREKRESLNRLHGDRPNLRGRIVIRLVALMTVVGWLALVLAELSIVLWNNVHG